VPGLCARAFARGIGGGPARREGGGLFYWDPLTLSIASSFLSLIWWGVGKNV